MRRILLCLPLLLSVLACGDENKAQDPPVVFLNDDEDMTPSPDQAQAADMKAAPDMRQPDMSSPDMMSPPDMRQPDMRVEPVEDMAPDLPPDDPCGNGVLDPGEVCDGDCPRSCDDRDACTQDTLSGSFDQCTSSCAHTPIAACAGFNGAYSGSYRIKAEEKVGSTVINSVTCTGTFEATVDASRPDHILGSATCAYGGRIGGFEMTQRATLTGKIAPDGTLNMRIKHVFGSSVNDGSFNVDGSIMGATFEVMDTGSFRPNAQSAVPWKVEITLGAP